MMKPKVMTVAHAREGANMPYRGEFGIVHYHRGRGTMDSSLRRQSHGNCDNHTGSSVLWVLY